MSPSQPNEQEFVPHNPPTHGDAAEHTYALTDGQTFVVLGPRAEIHGGQPHHGLFHGGMRHLSCLRLSVGGKAPIVLREGAVEDDAAVVCVMTNPLLEHGNDIEDEGALHILRRVAVAGGTLHERLEITSYARERLRFRLAYAFDADFADLFEVRGIARKRRGAREDDSVQRDRVELRYRGLDHEVRHSRLVFHPAPDELDTDGALYELELAPRGTLHIELNVSCGHESRDAHVSYPQAVAALRQQRGPKTLGSTVRASDARLDGWLQRSYSDLLLLRREARTGPYCQAGLPWFATLFGRDGLITAWQALWLAPDLAAGTLRAVAAHQATELDPARDAEPGKIPHELRTGEMAALGEVPFGAYYGTADATLLFVMVAGAYLQRTADLELIESLWPNIEAALRWLVEYGDIDGDGFLEHGCNARGLVNQGWKDSPDAIVHADGSIPTGPIALAEVQGYAYAARLAAARMADQLGQTAMAQRLRNDASSLRERFERTFWSESLQTYVLALDGHKSPCHVRTSNAGHCLWTGIAEPARAARVIDGLLAPDMWSGWGIRTLSADEVAFNPMSYHRGSVWPHDCSLVAAGMANYGRPDATAKVLAGLLDASDHFERRRLPELFCGFDRVADEPPTPYPSACAPQAWAAAAGLSLLASSLGLHIDAQRRRVWLRRPVLPDGVDELQIEGLCVADSELDLHIHRHRGELSVSVRRSTGDADLVMVP